MEEFDKKLSSGNPITITKAFNSLLSEVKKQYENYEHDGNSKAPKESKELWYLKKKCFADDPSISLLASNCLVGLVKYGILQTSSMFLELISAIPETRCFSGIINAFFELFLIDLENQLNKNGVYFCPFNITAPQHPLITILIQNSFSWRDIYIKLKHIHSRDDRLHVYGYDMFRPLYLFIFCNPNETGLSELHSKIWLFLLNSYKSKTFEIFYDIISWMQVESKNHLYVVNDILIESINLKLNEGSYEVVDMLIVCLTSTVFYMLVNNLNPYEAISCIFHVFETCDKIKTYNIVLMILSEALYKSSINDLTDLLKLCLVVIENKPVNMIVSNVVKACVLNWIAHQCELTEEAVKLAKNILYLISKCDNHIPLERENNVEMNQCLKCSNQHIYFAEELCSLAVIFSQNNSAILIWLKKLHKAQQAILKYVLTFVSGLFLMDFNNTVSLEALNILQKCVGTEKQNYMRLQTLILFKLSNTTDSLLHLALLKALPKTAYLKENLPLVLSVLHTLEKGPGNLKTLSIILSYELWLVDNKYYSHLENLLISEHKKATCNKYQFYMAKAYVIKELCKQRAELYGRELVIHLSKILNECSNCDYALPCSLAIDAIAVLCKENVIDIETTWTTLAPKYCEEQRVPVIASLCKFMAQMSALQYEYSYTLMDKITEILWKYSTTNENYEVVVCALKALESFSFDCVSVQIQKELNLFRDEKSVEIEMFANIPDSFWINLLQVNLYPSLWGNFLISLINKEIENYTKGVYSVQENQGEPENYKYLPKNSIVKAVGNYLKEKVENWNTSTNKEVYLQCLRIFSHEYCKPLPPINWSFLQQIVHHPEARRYCISIASHQLIVSGSALHFIESFIKNVTHSWDNVEDIAVLYENLKYLCNSIQPIILKPFIENTLEFAITLTKNDHELFRNILIQLKQTISNDDIQHVNKSVINKIILDVYKKHDMCWNFNEFIKCLCSLPPNLINEISDLRQQKDLSHDIFKNCVKVRCTLGLAAVETPLTWISDIIDNVNAGQLRHRDNFILKNIYPVLQKHADSGDCQRWILELLGKVQALIADAPEEQEQIIFLCKVFMISVIVLSGNNIFITKSVDDFLENNIHMLFPQSVALLMEQKDWASICNSQILEWFIHVLNTTVIPEKYKKGFQLSLMALRHTEQFKNDLKWMKYVDVKILP